MTVSSRQKPSPLKPKRMFRKRQRVPSGVIARQLIAVLLMLSAGVGIIFGLQRLPEQVDVVLLVSEAVADLIRGVQQLLEAFLGLAAVVLVATLVVLAIVLILGGAWRLLRLISLLIRRQPPQGRR